MGSTAAEIAFFTDATLEREEIDRFLDPQAPSWAQFDSELGYLPHDSLVPDNIDGALSEYRYGPFGERLQINHADRPTRINTYGDSFTQCHQVSDGETWQEVLAAHIGEPIGNFGVGGFGVYQAVERMRRVEASAASSPYIVLNIYLDDHYRNLDAYRLLRLGRWWRDYDRSLTTSMFHANPWRHVRIDAATTALVPQENICPTPESLYNLCDTDFLIDAFGHDFVARKLIADQSGDYRYLAEHEDLARALSIDFRPDTAPRETAHALWEGAAFRATESILASLKGELHTAGKRLLVALTYPADEVARYISTGERTDQSFVEALTQLGIPVIDGLELHADDYRDFSISPEAYTDRFWAGHYTPLGNAHFAFMIKRRLVEWLDPAPPAYDQEQASFARQAGRLA